MKLKKDLIYLESRTFKNIINTIQYYMYLLLPLPLISIYLESVKNNKGVVKIGYFICTEIKIKDESLQYLYCYNYIAILLSYLCKLLSLYHI